MHVYEHCIMGICTSCEFSTSAATAKLIFDNGRLEEFPQPIKACRVLQNNPSCFICNSDELDFDDVVPAVDADDELLPGHLYFALPLCRMNRRLQPAEIAALAVKASVALTRSGRRLRKVVEYSAKNWQKRSMKVAVSGGGEARRKHGGGGGGGARRRGQFMARLAAIPE